MPFSAQHCHYGVLFAEKQYVVKVLIQIQSVYKIKIVHRDIAVLPKLTDEGLRVTIFRIRPEYPENSADVAAAVQAILLVSDVRMRDEDLITGDVFIYEVSTELLTYKKDKVKMLKKC